MSKLKRLATFIGEVWTDDGDMCFIDSEEVFRSVQNLAQTFTVVEHLNLRTRYPDGETAAALL